MQFLFSPIVSMIWGFVEPIMRDRARKALFEVGLPLAEDVVAAIRSEGISGEDAMRAAIPRLESAIVATREDLKSIISVSIIRLIIEMAYNRTKYEHE